MTVNDAENKQDNSLPQEKVDMNLIQQKVDATPSQQPQDNKSAEEPKEDPNWRAFREARKKDRVEREAAEKRATEKEAEAHALKAAMEAILNKNQPVHQSNQYGYQEQAEESEDERIEKKVQAAIAQREAASERARQEREQQEYPQRLAQTYPDFNSAISSENLDYLEFHYPEVAAPLKRLPDNYDKWADIYRAIKKFVPNHAAAKKDSARADANFNKPKSMSSASVTQSGESGGGSSRISREQREANWTRMQRTLKGLS